MTSKKNYVSLFSSAGIGDYGFYQAGFNLIASNELLDRRMNIQRVNHNAKFDTAYILGDIQLHEIKEKLFDEVEKWNKSLNSVDLLVATPPCQGISVANHYKKESDLQRNSLVLQSILIAERIKPKTIVFENVKRFMQTACTDTDNCTYEISEVIDRHLSDDYNIYYRELNFKDYGANSSRPRTLVICTRKDIFGQEFSPELLMPDKEQSKTLFQVIGDLPVLESMGEIDDLDIFHEFKSYRADMRAWIHDLKEGQGAFENKDVSLRPHRIIDGKLVPNVNKNGDKYRRQFWDKVAPAVHTRNDILASQNTVHPRDDRVFSIRELMRMMNIPKTFKWTKKSEFYLNQMSVDEKKVWLKKNEMLIRQSLGEAVPTVIFYKIGLKIENKLDELNEN